MYRFSVLQEEGVTKELLRYIIKRILWLIPVIICVSLIIFTLMELAPGTILDNIATGSMTQADIDELTALYDLDKPMIYRYGKYVFKLVQGDLGVSDYSGNDVWNTYISRLPNTLILTLAALIIGTVVSIPMGIVAARRAGSIVDTATTTFTLIGMSMPGFWLGLLLLFVFSYKLGWLPAGGYRQGIKSLILPAVCSGLLLMANSARQTRSSMLEVLNADYLRTARAKGVPERSVIRSHALGNAWIPILTTIGTSISVSLAGSAVIESVFTWPGVGRMTIEAVLARDVTTTCGCVIMTTILYVMLQLLVDILYAFADPRIKAQYTAGRKRKRSSESSQKTGSKAINKPTDSPDVPATSRALAEESLPDVRQEELISEDIFPSIAHVDLPEKTAPETQEQATGNTIKETAETGPYSAKPDRVSEPAGLVSRIYRKRSRLGEVSHRISRNKSAMAGFIILVFLILVLAGSLFIDFESVTDTSPNRLSPPTWQLPFGSDIMGRNMFLRTIYGTRYSLLIGFAAVSIAAFLGILFGSIAGYYGKLADDIIMRASDVLASIPALLLGLVIVAVLGQSIPNLIIAVGITGTPVFVRITRSAILLLKGQEFVEAARAIGLRNPRIILSHVLPNGLAPIIVTYTAHLGLSIIVAASLSFLGFGVPLPYPEWGTLVSSGREFLSNGSHIMTFPGLFIMITVLAFNLLGDGLRDALDPKLKR